MTTDADTGHIECDGCVFVCERGWRGGDVEGGVDEGGEGVDSAFHSVGRQVIKRSLVPPVAAHPTHHGCVGRAHAHAQTHRKRDGGAG